MDPYLLIDFGTSSTKSALVDLDTGVFAHVRRHAPIPPEPTPPGRFEVALDAVSDGFDGICAAYAELIRPAALGGIVLCSEQMGFTIVDTRTGEGLTPYVSWVDQRSLEEIDGISTASLVFDQHLGPRFRSITGNRPRPGCTLPNLIHHAREAELPPEALVLSLPGWLAFGAARSGGFDRPGPWSPPPEHPTMLACMGVYDVSERRISDELTRLVRDLTGLSVRVGEPAPAGTVAGHWRGGGAPVPIHVGIGDHQCSVLGAGVIDGDTVSINLGTGSQVAVLDSAADDVDIELRPYFNGPLLSAVTGIPGGRALAEFVGFLEHVAAYGTSAADAGSGEETRVSTVFWDRLAHLDLAAVDAATLELDLGVFKGSRGFREGGGHIRGIMEGRLDVDNYLASLLSAFVDQYVEVIDLFDPERRLRRCVLSGGIARKLPELAPLVASRTGYEVLPATALDESIIGLRTIALVASGQASTCAEAQRRFGRECQVLE